MNFIESFLGIKRFLGSERTRWPALTSWPRFRDVPNPAFRRVAANIATTGRSQVPGHTDVIATDVDTTLTQGQDEKCYRLYGVSWGFLHEIQCGLPWHHTKLLERNKKQNFAGFKKSRNLAELEPKKSITNVNGHWNISSAGKFSVTVSRPGPGHPARPTRPAVPPAAESSGCWGKWKMSWNGKKNDVQNDFHVNFMWISAYILS